MIQLSWSELAGILAVAALVWGAGVAYLRTSIMSSVHAELASRDKDHERRYMPVGELRVTLRALDDRLARIEKNQAVDVVEELRRVLIQIKMSRLADASPPSMS